MPSIGNASVFKNLLTESVIPLTTTFICAVSIFSFICRRSVPRRTRKLNPLRHIRTMIKLNPYAAVLKRRARRSLELKTLAKEAILLKKEGVSFWPEYFCVKQIFVFFSTKKIRSIPRFICSRAETFDSETRKDFETHRWEEEVLRAEENECQI